MTTMSYVKNNLLPGEVVLHCGRLHWMRYFWSGAWLVSGLLVCFASGSGKGVAQLLIGGVLGCMAFLDISTSEFAVTNRRVYLKQGIIRQRAVEMLLSKIESVSVEQGLFGRIFGFGTLIPGGSGGTKQGFRKIAAPLEFRKQITAQIETVHKAA